MLNIIDLTTRYSEPHRHFHNLNHISLMLTSAPESLSAEQIAAIWFHDAVYRPGSPTNEEDSAELARQTYDLNCSNKKLNIDIICQIILDTKTHTPSCTESALVCDLDMAVLGSEYLDYSNYTKAIRREYSGTMSEQAFNEGRKPFLESLLLQKYIFHTAWARGKFERWSRYNIKNELSSICDLKRSQE